MQKESCLKIVHIHSTLITFQTIKYNLKILDKAMKNIPRAIKLFFQLGTNQVLRQQRGGWLVLGSKNCKFC